MKLLLASVLLMCAAPAFAQAPPSTSSGQAKIEVALDVEALGAPAEAATTLQNEIRKGLQTASDVTIVSRTAARRVVRVIVTVADGVYGASLLVTEQYDRPTLMVLGIEDDDLAERMMRLQIVNEHQGYSGRDLSEIGRRIVVSLDEGVFRALRSMRRQ
jgi:hypothetical protein